MAKSVGILIFKSMINVMLSWVEQEESFIVSGPVFLYEYIPVFCSFV